MNKLREQRGRLAIVTMMVVVCVMIAAEPALAASPFEGEPPGSQWGPHEFNGKLLLVGPGPEDSLECQLVADDSRVAGTLYLWWDRFDGLTTAVYANGAWASPVMAEFIASLPVSGSDGTLKKRLNGGPASGRAHLKTGYLDSVRSLAGYVLDAHGKRWIVVALINDANARAGKPALDALVDGIAGR